jgi:hypothetical protein
LLRASTSCACRLQAALLVLRVQSGDQLARLDVVADIHRAFDQPPVDAERLVDLGLRLHRASQRHRAAGGALVDGHRAHRADLGGGLLHLALAGTQQGQRGQQGHERAGAGKMVGSTRDNIN